MTHLQVGSAAPLPREACRALLDRCGLTVVEIMDAIHAERVKGMYIMGENPLRAMPQPDRVKNALKNLEFIVVQDILNSETARIADVSGDGVGDVLFFNAVSGDRAENPGRLIHGRSDLALLGDTVDVSELHGVRGVDIVGVTGVGPIIRGGGVDINGDGINNLLRIIFVLRLGYGPE